MFEKGSRELVGQSSSLLLVGLNILRPASLCCAGSWTFPTDSLELSVELMPLLMETAVLDLVAVQYFSTREGR